MMNENSEGRLDIEDQEGVESSLLAALADLDGGKVDLDTLSEVLNLSDEDLTSFATDPEIGIQSLESFLAPGGGWGGTLYPCRRAAQIGVNNGLMVTGQKRTWGSTGSDHHVSQRQAFAVDLSNSTSPSPEMLRTARQIAAAMGYNWDVHGRGGFLETRVTSRGYRAQLIYNPYPNHSNHVHFGVKKVR